MIRSIITITYHPDELKVPEIRNAINAATSIVSEDGISFVLRMIDESSTVTNNVISQEKPTLSEEQIKEIFTDWFIRNFQSCPGILNHLSVPFYIIPLIKTINLGSNGFQTDNTLSFQQTVLPQLQKAS